MSDIDALWAELKGPRGQDDWQLWSVLADAYADAGDARLESHVRWMVRFKKRPLYGAWWDEANPPGNWHDDDPESNLPHHVYALVERKTDGASKTRKWFGDTRAACEGLFSALDKL